MWPKDETIAKRLKRDPKSSEARRLSELHRFRREVKGLTSAYEHVLKAIDSDKPYADVYLQGADRCKAGANLFGNVRRSSSHETNFTANRAFHTCLMMESQKFSIPLCLCLCRRLNPLAITVFYSVLCLLYGRYSINYTVYL